MTNIYPPLSSPAAWTSHNPHQVCERLRAEIERIRHALQITERACDDRRNASALVSDAFIEYRGDGPTASRQLLEDEQFYEPELARGHGLLLQPNAGEKWIVGGVYPTLDKLRAGEKYALDNGFHATAVMTGSETEIQAEADNLTAGQRLDAIGAIPRG